MVVIIKLACRQALQLWRAKQATKECASSCDAAMGGGKGKRAALACGSRVTSYDFLQ